MTSFLVMCHLYVYTCTFLDLNPKVLNPATVNERGAYESMRTGLYYSIKALPT